MAHKSTSDRRCFFFLTLARAKDPFVNLKRGTFLPFVVKIFYFERISRRMCSFYSICCKSTGDSMIQLNIASCDNGKKKQSGEARCYAKNIDQVLRTEGGGSQIVQAILLPFRKAKCFPPNKRKRFWYTP